MRDLKAITRVLIFFFAALASTNSASGPAATGFTKDRARRRRGRVHDRADQRTRQTLRTDGGKRSRCSFQDSRQSEQDPALRRKTGRLVVTTWREQTDEKQCREKVQSFLQGSLRSRPDVDLNAYYLLALNEEANISVIDPLLGFGSSKLLTLVMLKSPGEDWVQKTSDEKLFVSMPLANQIAVVDTSTWKVVANIDTGMKPARVRLQPDERYLWVGNDARGGVTVIDTATLKVVGQVSTGKGHHELEFSNDNRFAFHHQRG